MRLSLDWIFEQPIDLEYKEYIILDYISKIDKDIDNFKIYPALQELSLHLANLTSIRDSRRNLVLKRKPVEVDDEILMSDLEYHELDLTDNELSDVVKIAIKTHEMLKDYFLIAKSIWSLIFDAILIKLEEDYPKLDKNNYDSGYLHFIYKDEVFLYEYSISKLHKDHDEDKCTFTLLFKGKDEKNCIEYIKKNKPVFSALFNNEYPLQGALLSVTKRKIINYVKQTINITKIKEEKDVREKKIS